MNKYSLNRFSKLAGIILGIFAVFSSLAQPVQSIHEIQSNNLLIQINERGEIQKAVDKNSSMEFSMKAYTFLQNCEQAGQVTSEHLPDGGIEFHKEFKLYSDPDKSCKVTESFIPAENSIQWKIIIQGTGDSWSTGIQTDLQFTDTSKNKFWTTWGDHNQTHPCETCPQKKEGWFNPLQAMPFRDIHLIYGGHFTLGGGYSVPVVSVLNDDANSGISLVMSPEDLLLDLHLETTKNGAIKQTRYNHRINSVNTIVFTMDIISHTADWRGPMGWMVNKYPKYFNPVCSKADEISGCGAYSANEEPVDVALFKSMGGIVNWKASFDFPYMGMFIPPVDSDTTQWPKFKVETWGQYLKDSPKTYSSISKMSAYDTYFRSKGFYSLNYFNVTEFGGGSDYADSMLYTSPNIQLAPDEIEWLNPNYFLYKNFPDAILFASHDNIGWNNINSEQLMFPRFLKHEKPFYTWGNALITDCGDAAYQKYLLEQAEKHVQKFPDASGICIDRLDWLNEYNWKHDDFVSWVGDQPVRSLLVSWRNFIPQLSNIFHRENKVVYCNPLTNRLELMRYIDGIYNEYAQLGFNLNLSAFLALNKTLIAWTPGSYTVLPNPDEYFQRHLFMGAFPTAPFPGNDHTIEPDKEVEKFYVEYGPLLNRLHGKKWVLVSDIIKVEGNAALVNIFQTGDKYIIPVVFAHEKEGVVSIILKRAGDFLTWKNLEASFIHPGKATFSAAKISIQNEQLICKVPVHKGCALLEIKESKND